MKLGTDILRFFSLFRLRAYDLIIIGFASDTSLRGYIYSIACKYSRAERQIGLANLLCSVFAVLYRRRREWREDPHLVIILHFAL